MPDATASVSLSPPQSQRRYGGVPRKRNVTSRDRNGCVTCRKRHLRCDKTHPECNNCSKMNRICEGYVNRISFCDETFSVTQKAQGRPSKQAQRRHSKATSEDIQQSTQQNTIAIGDSRDEMGDLHDQYMDSITPTSDVAVFPNGEDWMFQDWDLSTWSSAGQEVAPLSASTSPLPNMNLLSTATQVNMAQTDQFSTTMEQIPSISRSLPLGSSEAYQLLCFPQDEKYMQRLQDNQIEGLVTIVTLGDLVVDESIMASHCWSAALAISALTASQFSSTAAECMIHARYHYRNAVQNIQKTFPEDALSSIQVTNCTGGLLSWLLTHLLLANFDLYRGKLSSWRRHLRVSGRIFSKWHQSILNDKHGRILARTLARMALLVELQNGDMALNKVQDMNPGVASQLESMMEASDCSRDRLLLLIRDVSKVELKYRHRPELHEKWCTKMQLIDERLMVWQRNLPPSELPVDTGVAEPVEFPVDPGSSLVPLGVLPLTFPNSANPFTSAVNYAHFLCSRMRARTRYMYNGEKIRPADTESIVLYICRIAAGLSPRECAKANAFGHGIMPALVGSYRWTMDIRVCHWINSWLRAYEDQSGREGLWHVGQARRLVSFLDDETRRRRITTTGCWDIVAARVEDEDEPSGDYHGTMEEPIDYSSPTGDEGECRAMGPFKAVVHSRCSTGWATDHYIIA